MRDLEAVEKESKIYGKEVNGEEGKREWKEVLEWIQVLLKGMKS